MGHLRVRPEAYRPGSADQSKPVYTGRTIAGAVLSNVSTTITKTGDYRDGLGSIPTHPAPGRGLRLLSTPPAQRHPVHPGPAHSVQLAPMGD
jgi:hypothetical protein